jgi:endonuclease/exonuclease/phosphatase family metal-dependent hydrolase
MSFNLHHGVGADGRLDLGRSAALVEATGADVVALQEVDSHLGPRSDSVDQPVWLARRLMMDVAYGATIDLAPTRPGGPRRRYGTALLSRHQIHDPRALALPYPPGDEPRGLLTGTVVVGGTPVRVVATHLQHDSAAARGRQAEALAAEVAAVPGPVALLGDLNAVPGSPELAPLDRDLVDAWVVAGDGPGATFPSNAPRTRIDYVMASRDLTVTAAAVVATDASDHRPVLADLLVPTSPSPGPAAT